MYLANEPETATLFIIMIIVALKHYLPNKRRNK